MIPTSHDEHRKDTFKSSITNIFVLCQEHFVAVALSPNYSQWGGSLISASLSDAYYPESNRGAGLVFTNFRTSIGLHVVLGLAQEFILDKFTSNHKR
jgi:hypothetical protein